MEAGKERLTNIKETTRKWHFLYSSLGILEGHSSTSGHEKRKVGASEAAAGLGYF